MYFFIYCIKLKRDLKDTEQILNTMEYGSTWINLKGQLRGKNEANMLCPTMMKSEDTSCPMAAVAIFNLKNLPK